MNSDKIFEEKLKKIQNLEFEPSQIADIQKALDHFTDVSKTIKPSDSIDVTGYTDSYCYKCNWWLGKCTMIGNDCPKRKDQEFAESLKKMNEDFEVMAFRNKNYPILEQQLQQKERECETLKGRLKFKSDYDRANERKLFSLKKENGTLKQEFHKYMTQLKAKDAEIENKEKFIKKLLKEIKELKKASADVAYVLAMEAQNKKIREELYTREKYDASQRQKIEKLQADNARMREGLERIKPLAQSLYGVHNAHGIGADILIIATQTLEEIKGNVRRN